MIIYKYQLVHPFKIEGVEVDEIRKTPINGIGMAVKRRQPTGKVPDNKTYNRFCLLKAEAKKIVSDFITTELQIRMQRVQILQADLKRVMEY